jgi:geranylgeranylglycerol-phosphate geranylgeranyltransferase
MSFTESARGLLDLTRPGNLIAAAVLTLTGAFVAGGVTSQPAEVGIAVAATGLAVGAGNSINDYFDRDIDRHNNPERPIPRGSVSPRTALVFSIVLFSIAGGLALMLPIVATAIAAINLAALVMYTEFFKGRPGIGNALVAYLVGSTFLFGAAAVGQLIGAVVILFLLSALSTGAREIIKDVEDIRGDREEGLNTLPIAIGERRALLIAAILLVVVVLTSPVPYLLGTFGITYLVLVAPAVTLMLYAGYRSFSDPTVGQSILKYGTFIAAAAFIGGRLTLVM